jgi:hypothetical protein
VIPIRGDQYGQLIGLREALPEGDLATVPWRRHHPTHVLVAPESVDYNVGLFVKTVRMIAQVGQGSDFGGVGVGTDTPQTLARLGAAFLMVSSGMGGNVNI